MTDPQIEVLPSNTTEQVPDPTAEEAARAVALANASTDSPPAPQDDRREAQPAPIPQFEDPRKAIAKDWRSRRLDQMNGNTEDFNDPGLTDPSVAAARALEQANAGQQPTDPKPGEQAPIGDPPPARQMVKVKVEGVEKEVPLDTLVSTYQKNETADIRLQQATELLKSAKNTVTAGVQPPTKTDHESGSDHSPSLPTSTKTEEPTQSDGPDEQVLMEVAESMMSGSPAEAVQALKKAFAKTAPQQQPADIDAQVDKAIALREEKSVSAKALAGFGTKHAAAKTDRIVEAAVTQILRDEMVNDLKQAGVTDAFIEQFHLTQPEGFKVLKDSHQYLRAANVPGVRKVDELLTVVEKNPGFIKLTGTGQPAPQIAVDRGERKQGVQEQPALRTAAPPTQQRAPSPQDRAAKQASAVENMRKSRGQSAYGA